MRIAFRCDASRVIGSGHVVRCATLASKLPSKGAEIHFLCRELPGHYCDWLEHRGFTVHRLTAAAQSSSPGVKGGLPAHVGWLGVSAQQELEESLAVLAAFAPFDWLIVDHYALDSDWEKAMRIHARKVMAIDDLADRPHDCDLLLDQNFSPDPASRYHGKLPERCKLMFGPDYALLQDEYARLRANTLPRKGPVRRVLVFFGGVDLDNLTGLTITAIQQISRSDIIFDVVVGSGNPNFDSIVEQTSDSNNIELHRDLPTLAPLMGCADLAIGAAGASTWERCCLGLPSIAVSLAENQHPIAAALAAKELVRWLGTSREVSVETIVDAIRKALDDPGLETWSNNCREIVDGLGTTRVSAVLTASADMPLKIRRATTNDEALILAWANDPVVRENSFSQGPIDAETHHKWFTSCLGRVDEVRLFIFETPDGVPLGQVRFEYSDQVWRISYSLDPLFRGIDLGRCILERGIGALCSEFGGCRVLGTVKANNHSSRRIFQGLGFEADIQHESVNFSLLCPASGGI